jgi:hypothetical protein
MKRQQFVAGGRPKKSRKGKKALLIAAIIIVALGGTIAALELTNTTHLFHAAKPVGNRTANSETKGETPQSNNTSQGQTNNTPASQPSSSDNKSPTSDGGASATTLLVPSGDFVSNHHPNLGGSPAPNQITSVCNTTPGASCQIIFTKDGVTKSLPAQTTDKGGATYWNNWKLQDIGLTTGSWHIQAKATLANQTKTADDAMNLEVGQ